MKTIIYILLAIILSVIGLWGYKYVERKFQSPLPSSPIQAAPFGSPTDQKDSSVLPDQYVSTDQTPLVKSGTIQELLSLGSAVRCDFKTDDGKISGVMYSDGKNRARVEARTLAMPGQITYVIYDNNYSFTWLSSTNQGFKTEIQSAIRAAAATGQHTMINQKVKYDCVSWTVVENMLIPPSTVQFHEIPATY